MFDTNVLALISGSDVRPVENVNPFFIEANIASINPRTDHGGLLELQVVRAQDDAGKPTGVCAVFLFRGSLSAAECEANLAQENPNFDLAACIGQSAEMKLEPSIGQFTIFSLNVCWGFVRTIQIPRPPYNTQAKLA